MTKLREHAEQIWRAGVEAVRPERLLADQLAIDGDRLFVDDLEVALGEYRRITVVGGGKAGAGMARGLEAVLGESTLAAKQVAGLMSVPADCVAETQSIRLVAGRPAGANEPRPEGADAADEMLRTVASIGQHDLCICLISGGGSALLPSPIDGVTLDEKLAATRLLSAAGATINQLNTVRSAISRIKGGGLARACRAKTLLTLIISDVLGDPLDLIASGPTVQATITPADALAVFDELAIRDDPDAAPIVAKLEELIAGKVRPSVPTADVHNIILANNATAVDAAGMEAERLGYNHAMTCATTSEGAAEDVGTHLAAMAVQMRDQPGPNCLITGGEPTVKLAPKEIRGRGGRNQQLVLKAFEDLGDCRGVALLSGGTDGEDGPTDAAGAVVDEHVARAIRDQGLDAADTLRRNDAYTLFDKVGGLITTGPTGTNVCDLRVVTVDQSPAKA